MSSQHTTRAARTEDIDAITHLALQVQALHRDSHPDRHPTGEINATCEWLQRELDDENVHARVAVNSDDQVIGYLITRVFDRPESPFSKAHRFLMVDQIGVDESCEGHGVGSALMKQAFELAKDLDTEELQLTVWDFNERAQGFFAAHGFAPLHHRFSAPVA